MRDDVAANLSIVLSELESASTALAARGAVTRLRWRVENGPVDELEAVAQSALDVSDGICWTALAAGHTGVFLVAAVAARRLFEFCENAQLLETAQRR